MKYVDGRLWRHRDFLKLWSAETISTFGDAISDVALPLVAIATLGVGAREMGILRALDSVPILLFGLFVGVWVDRGRQRSLMIATQLGQGILLATVPVTTAAGVLRIELLYFVSFFGGMLSAIFTIASTTFLPSIVSQEDLVEGNSKLSISRSVAQISGPGLAGALDMNDQYFVFRLESDYSVDRPIYVHMVTTRRGHYENDRLRRFEIRTEGNARIIAGLQELSGAVYRTIEPWMAQIEPFSGIELPFQEGERGIVTSAVIEISQPPVG